MAIFLSESCFAMSVSLSSLSESFLVLMSLSSFCDLLVHLLRLGDAVVLHLLQRLVRRLAGGRVVRTC